MINIKGLELKEENIAIWVGSEDDPLYEKLEAMERDGIVEEAGVPIDGYLYFFTDRMFN